MCFEHRSEKNITPDDTHTVIDSTRIDVACKPRGRGTVQTIILIDTSRQETRGMQHATCNTTVVVLQLCKQRRTSTTLAATSSNSPDIVFQLGPQPDLVHHPALLDALPPTTFPGRHVARYPTSIIAERPLPLRSQRWTCSGPWSRHPAPVGVFERCRESRGAKRSTHT